MKFIKIPNQNYEMMDTVVTQLEWKEVMGNNPSNFKGKDLPVEQVSWKDCQLFIKKLNDKQDGFIYRLPLQTEWEYCAKSCDKQKIEDISWNYENSGSKTHPVKTKKPNELQIYDMLGNVWEWTNSIKGSYRVVRGGSWGSGARRLRSAFRSYVTPSVRNSDVGFRLLRSKIPTMTFSYDYEISKENDITLIEWSNE